jgi:hypothetical protein
MDAGAQNTVKSDFALWSVMSRKENPETPNETLSGTPHVVKQGFRTLGLTFFFRSQFLSSRRRAV